MPWLDVSNVLLDPEFCDTVSITRRADVVSANGRSEISGTVFDAYGVVTIVDPSKLTRFAEGQYIPRAISFITKSRLNSAVTGFQPDQITWNGAVYTVNDVQPYTRYGAGFVEVLALSQNAQDAPLV